MDLKYLISTDFQTYNTQISNNKTPITKETHNKRSDKSSLWNQSSATTVVLALKSKQNKHKQFSEIYTHKQQMKGSSMSDPSNPLFSEGSIYPSIPFPSSQISEQTLKSSVFFLVFSSVFLLKNLEDLKDLGYGGRGERLIWDWWFCFWTARQRRRRNGGGRRRGLPWKWEEEWAENWKKMGFGDILWGLDGKRN